MTDRVAPITSDRDPRLRAAFTSGAEVAGTGASCPPADALWESAAGRSDNREREAVILHLGECSACAAAWRLARDLRRDDSDAAVLAGPDRWFRRTWVQAAALAAALIVAAGLAVQLRTASREPASEFRGEEGDWIQSLVPAGRPLPRERCLLSWTPGPAHTIYDVRVTTEDLRPVARSLGRDRAEFLVPSETLKGMPPGARIVWQVTAHLPDGVKVDSRSFIVGLR